MLSQNCQNIYEKKFLLVTCYIKIMLVQNKKMFIILKNVNGKTTNLFK